MHGRLGIGIATFERAERLAQTLDSVRRLTATRHRLLVADDGSTDGTIDLLRRLRVPHVHGANRGVAWNKNRLLVGLAEMLACDVVILLEDDTMPVRPGWERIWVEAARLFGHANLAGDWMLPHVVSGAGMPGDPYRSRLTSGQCAVFSKEALAAAGYMDTRFGRYGYEHAEHTERLVKSGFGGDPATGEVFLLRGDLLVTEGDAHRHAAALEEAARIYHGLKGSDLTTYRPAWRSDEELDVLRRELRDSRFYGPSRLSPGRLWRTAAPVMRWRDTRRRRSAHAALRAALGAPHSPAT